MTATMSLNGGPEVPFDPVKVAVDLAEMARLKAALPRVEMNITVPARSAAIAWLNAWLATSHDEERGVLCRTLSLEAFSDGTHQGLHIIGCDGTALVRAWVPTVGTDAEHAEVPWPDLGEDPSRTVIAMDVDGFGVGFMRSLLRVTSDDGHALEELTITTAPYDDEATLSLGEEFMAERLTLRSCGQRIDLKTREGPYPGWRQIEFGKDVKRVDGMTVATRMFAMIGKLKGVDSVALEFEGEDKKVSFFGRGGLAKVRGFLMPMRDDAKAAKKAAEQEAAEPELPENGDDASSD